MYALSDPAAGALLRPIVALHTARLPPDADDIGEDPDSGVGAFPEIQTNRARGVRRRRARRAAGA
ncbi:hypothetical protein GCM10017691_43990 [Pseudonocardia petroleophila]